MSYFGEEFRQINEAQPLSDAQPRVPESPELSPGQCRGEQAFTTFPTVSGLLK